MWASIALAHVLSTPPRQEHTSASLTLRLRTPDEMGKWAWGTWCEAIPLPEAVFTYLWQGASTQAPTLRGMRSVDVSRVVKLGLMLEVSPNSVSPLEQK